MITETNIVQATATDWPWINAHSEVVGGPNVVSQGVRYTLTDYPALLAISGSDNVGFVVYRADGPEWEVLAIVATRQWEGIGSKLISTVETLAAAANAKSIFLVTTNDNLPALQFYQRRGYELDRLVPNGFEAVRRLKNLGDEEILGHADIPIRDELRLSKAL